MANVYWKELNGRKVVDLGASFATEEGDLIYWHGQESSEAQTKLSNISKKSMSHTEKFNRIMEAGKPEKKKKAPPVVEKMIVCPENSSYFQRTLAKCTYAGNILYLPKERLENYADLKKGLENSGAKYKNGTFIFPNDAEPFINRLMTGDDTNLRKKFQFFATPPKVAQMVVDQILWERDAALGEFSAGQGGLLDLVPKDIGLKLNVVELMPENCAILRKKGYEVQEGDFLSKHWGMVDIIVLNPPFSKNQDIAHFMHAWDHLNRQGQISCVMSPHWVTASDKKSKAFREFLDEVGATWQEIDAGEFKTSGTNIKTMLVTACK